MKKGLPKILTLFFLLALGITNVWAAYTYNAATSVPEWTVNFNDWAAADDAATTAADAVHNPRLYWNGSAWKNNSTNAAIDIAYDGGGFYIISNPGTARQLPTDVDELAALCYAVSKALNYPKYANSSSTATDPSTLNGLSANTTPTAGSNVAVEIHAPRDGYVRILFGTDSNGEPSSGKTVTLSGATTGTANVTYYASTETYGIKTKLTATTFSTTTITASSKKLKSVEFAVNAGTTTVSFNPSNLSNSPTSARKLLLYAMEVYLESAAPATTYTVTYKAGLGTGSDVVDNAATTVADCPAGFTAPTGQVFAGWKDASDNDVAVGATVSADMTLTAQWATAYTVTYNAGEGTGTVPTETAKTTGATFEVAGQGAMTHATKVFNGWKDQNGTAYAAGATYTVGTENVVLTAQWKAAPKVLFLWQNSETSAPNGSEAVVITTTTGGTTTACSSDFANKTWAVEDVAYDATVPGDLKATVSKGLKSGGNALYLQLTLSGTEKFQTGDTIWLCGYGSWMVSTTTEHTGDVAASMATGAGSKTSCKAVYAVIPEGINTNTLYVRRVANTIHIAAIKVIRPVKYTVSFAAGDGGTGTMEAKKYPAGATVTLPECTFTAPSLKEFDAWTSSDVTISSNQFTMPANDVTVTATWKNETPKYTVTYSKGAYGTGTIVADTKVKDIALTLSSERFTRDGYLQTGWAETDGGAQAYALGASYTANAPIELFPVWTAVDTYTASFACADAAPAGWTFSNDGYDTDSKATANYVCKFTENSLTAPDNNGMSADAVAFAKNANAIATYDLGITTTVAALNVVLTGGSSNAFNEEIELLGADGTTVKQSYTTSLSAGNWKDNAINKTDIIEDIRYIRVHGASKWIVMKSFSVSYIETRTKYDVAFAAGTGASGSMATLQYIEGAEVTLPASTFTAPTDKEFDVWTSSDVTITDGKFTMPAKNVTVTATWKDAVTRFTVTFETNGGSSIDAQEVEINGHPAAVDDPTKDHNVFVGWYNNSDLADEHAVADITALTITEDITLYAKWALDLQVTKIVFSNGFDAFINGSTVTAYYMDGEAAPTIESYEANANVKTTGGVLIEGSKLVLVGTDDSRKEYNFTLDAVAPLTALEAEQTFDGSEAYVKSAYGWKGDSKGWAFQKVVTPDDGRKVKGLTREYFFFGPAKSASFGWKVSKKNSGDACVAKIYVNGTEVMDALTENFEVTLNKNTTNMVAIVSQQHNGDCGLASVKLNADYSRTEMLGAGVLGTICLDHNVPVATAQGASFYELVGKNDIGKIVFDEVVSGDLEAGVPYVFQAEGNLIALLYGSTEVSSPVNTGALKGTFTGETFSAEDAASRDIYFFRDHALWSAKETGLQVLANRAWLEMGDVNPITNPNPAPGRRRITLGVNGTNVATGLEDLEVGEAPMKVMMNGQLFILRGEKIYDATGRLVK